MKRAFMCCLAFVATAAFAAACDRGGKEGEFCYTSTAKSTDCSQGLICAKCAEGNICVYSQGESDYGLKVQGKQCQRLTAVSEFGEIQRGAP